MAEQAPPLRVGARLKPSRYLRTETGPPRWRARRGRQAAAPGGSGREGRTHAHRHDRHHWTERRGEACRLHRAASAGDRRRSVAAADPPYISSRASALTSAICAKDPLSASTSATPDVKMMALAGVRYAG